MVAGFATKNYVHEHMTKSHPEFLVEEEIILQNSILKKKKETLKQKVLCTLCGKSFRRDVLPKHTKLVHLKKKDYGCDLCGSLLNS